MHNAGYVALGIENWNLFISCKVKEDKLGKFIDAIRDLEIKGVSVTVPYKEKIVALLDVVDETAKKIGAVNTVVNIEGVLTGYNTDWIGAVNALEKKTGLKDKKTTVIGAGGAARAVVYGLVSRGANVKIFNRTIEKAQSLSL
jgi:shikimate dehydrogenase